MKKNNMKIRVIASALSVIAVFSAASVITTTSASAASISVTGIAKDVTSFALNKTIDKFVKNGVAGSLLKMGTGYLLNWIFSDNAPKSPTIKDALEKIDTLQKTVEKNHEEEMKSLRVINGNINTKDFRMEADSINDDYTAALGKIRQYSDNITTAGEGMIDNTTYRAYKAILADDSCDLSKLEKNFNVMKGYVLGQRHSTDKQSGYKTTTEYLYNKVLESFKETHNWKDSTDFTEVVNKINAELSTIHFDAGMDYITMLVLNNMAYKVKEYEVNNGIYKANENEKPYASFENFEKALTNTMKQFNDAYNKVIGDNNADGKMVQAVVTFAEPVDGKQTKGFRSFSEAWAQACSVKKDFTITLRDDIKSVKGKCFNFDKLDKNKYGFTDGGNFHVQDGRKVTVDLGGHTIDNTASPTLPTFGFESNTFLYIKDGTIKGGDNGLRADGRTKVHIKADNLTINDTSWAGIYIGLNSTGNYYTKDMKVELNNCTIRNAKNESGLRVLPQDSQIILTNCTFENCLSSKDGGAIYTESENEPFIKDCIFKNNKANNGCGGAIYSYTHTAAGSKLKVVGGLFEGNVSYKMSNDRYYTTIDDLKKGAGGAIACANLTADGVTFRNNSSNDQAGAIFIEPGMSYDRSYFTNSITNCTFEGNKADHVGGAIRLFHIDDRNVIKNCRFTDNSGRGENVFVEYGHGLGDKLIKDWGNTGNAKYNNGMYIVNK